MMLYWQAISFNAPWMFAFVILPWVVALLWKAQNKQQQPLLAPHLLHRISGNLDTKNLSLQNKSTKLSSFGLLLWGLLIIASMRPVWFFPPTNFNSSGKDMILAVDLSGSMQKQDMQVNGNKVNRLQAVKDVVRQFIKRREGDRLGLLVFGSQAYMQSPLTFDLDTIQTLLEETEIGMAGDNTAIGDAIGLTLKHLDKTHSETKITSENTVLILLTDGSNTAGSVEPIDAAQQAKLQGLKIYTIGIGQTERNNSLLQFFQGSNSQMDIETLQEIANLTQGKFYQAKDIRQLNAIYNEINLLESTTFKLDNYKLRTELFIWPLGLSLLLSFVWVALFLRKKHD